MSYYLSIANVHGNVDIRESVPEGFTHVRGKRLQPLCRKLEIQYADALVGWSGTRHYPKPDINGVLVSAESAPKLLRALSDREARSEKRRRREAKKQEEHLEQKHAVQRQDFVRRFRNASEETVAIYAGNSKKIFDSFDDVPMECLTEEEIADLQLVKEHPSGALLLDGGSTVIPLFRAKLPKNNAEEIPEQAHRKAMDLGFTAPKALWAANKLVKMVTYPPKREVYDLKDKLLQHWQSHLVEGRIARLETQTCWRCNGGGENRTGFDCYRCNGTGIYHSKTLYESRYRFPDDDRTYCFHGYSQPATLSNEPGADKQSYGHRFTPDERKELPFVLHDLINILVHELVLLEQAEKRRKADELMIQWSSLGLPALGPHVPAPKSKECLLLIQQLTAS